MDNKLHFAYIASSIIETYYIKLREFSYQNEEDSPEYDETVNKLKKAIQGESETYDELTNDDIESAINYFKQNNLKNVTEVRMINKLSETKRKRNSPNLHTNLANAITSKMIIDVLKRTTFKILKLKTTNFPEEDIDTLLLYNDIYKYNYLTGNEYIEKIAIDHKFDILSIPNIKFNEIEDAFKIEFIKQSSNINYDYIKHSIEELLNIKVDDKYLKMYITMFEVSRVEIMLPYLNKEMLIKLSDYLNSLNNVENNDAINKIKRLVAKRKEELH